MNLRLELVNSETGKSKLHQGTLGADMSAANQRLQPHCTEHLTLLKSVLTLNIFMSQVQMVPATC